MHPPGPSATTGPTAPGAKTRTRNRMRPHPGACDRTHGWDTQVAGPPRVLRRRPIRASGKPGMTRCYPTLGAQSLTGQIDNPRPQRGHGHPCPADEAQRRALASPSFQWPARRGKLRPPEQSIRKAGSARRTSSNPYGCHRQPAHASASRQLIPGGEGHGQLVRIFPLHPLLPTENHRGQDPLVFKHARVLIADCLHATPEIVG